ncbi:MAG: hypothetical protein PUP92_03260 [Rhizonema sp. PD38]|nr:hypothetical protein [Rhizonema sp. PD38]
MDKDKQDAAVPGDKAMALSSINISESIRNEIISLIQEYEGNAQFKNLSLCGRMFTTLAWKNYPDPSYHSFLKRVPAKLKNIIDRYGIEFFVLGKEDSCRVSGFKSEREIFIDMEEWDLNIPESNRIWNEEENVKSQIDDAIALFSKLLEQEIRTWIKSNLNLEIEEVYSLLD